MIETNAILEFAEDLIHQKTDTYCSELQRRILIDALQKERRTYDQLAEDCGYSSRYVKQDVAPKLWSLISQAVGEKINKSNVRAALEATMRSQALKTQAPTEDFSSVGFSPVGFSPVDHAPFNSAESAALSGNKANILLVDDQPQNLKLLSDLLEEQGYEVQQAINGAIALQAIRVSPPDLIFLDIHMPQMDGYTLCQYIKAEDETASIPVIFISAIDEPWDKVKAFSAGGCDYITKPFKVVEVLARLENHLKLQQLQKALLAKNVKLQQAIQELQRLAAIDEITQVACRRRFDTYLLNCWQQAEKQRSPLTLLLIQVDNFSLYGKAICSQAVDKILYDIAQVIQQSVQGKHDLVARYGAITFSVLLPQQTKSESRAIAQRILKRVLEISIPSESFRVSKCAQTKVSETRLTLSIGIAGTDFSEEVRRYLGIGEFLEAGERTLQKAKQNGNCIVDS